MQENAKQTQARSPDALLGGFSRGRIVRWLLVSAVVHVVFVALMSIGYIRDRWIDPAGAVARKAAAEAAKQELMKAMAPPAPKPVEKAPEAQSEPAEAPKPAAGDEAIPAGSAGGAEAKRITEAAPAAEIPTQPGDASALLDDTR